MSNFEFSKASIDTSEGDISIQSLKSIQATVELASKLYCATTYDTNNIIDTITLDPNNCSLGINTFFSDIFL